MHWPNLCRNNALPSRLRLVIIGGEKVSAEHWALWDKHAGSSVRLMNAYGLTETTVTSTLFITDGNSTRRSVPIGRPIANTTAYILDEGLQPAPIGVAGELFIGGLGVARGYRNAHRIKYTSFVANPFARDGNNFSTARKLRPVIDIGNSSHLEPSARVSRGRKLFPSPEQTGFATNVVYLIRERAINARHPETADKQFAGDADGRRLEPSSKM